MRRSDLAYGVGRGCSWSPPCFRRRVRNQDAANTHAAARVRPGEERRCDSLLPDQPVVDRCQLMS